MLCCCCYIKNGQNQHKLQIELPPNLKRRETINPSVKMRNLHWNPVNPFDVDKTIWNDVNEYENDIKIDVKTLEKKFCWKEIETNTSKANSTAANKRRKKKDVITVLDTKRAYNVEIFLARIKLNNWEIRTAMLSMNETVLTRDKIDKFINFVPTQAEAQSLTGYEDEPNLGKAETFFKILKTVDDNLKQRLELWSFKIQFDELLGFEKDKIIVLSKAAECLQNSKNFKFVLCAILLIGNYMNGGTKKGKAYGFKISSLTQLTRSRSVDNKQTLLEYLYEFLESQCKDSIGFVDDLAELENACEVDIPTLRCAMSSIGGKLKQINGRLKTLEKCSKMDDRFSDVMKPFYEYAEKTYKDVKDLETNVKNELNKIGIWLNEAKDTNCLYLKTINQFRKEFVKIKKMVAAKREKEKKAEERAKKRKAKKCKTKNSSGSGSDVDGDRDRDRDRESNSTAFSDGVLLDLQDTTSSEFVGLVRKKSSQNVAI